MEDKQDILRVVDLNTTFDVETGMFNSERVVELSNGHIVLIIQKTGHQTVFNDPSFEQIIEVVKGINHVKTNFNLR